MIPIITYATKVWAEDLIPSLERHKEASLVIGNNLGFEFVDIGPTSDPYFAPELVAVNAAEGDYIFWCNGDVVPPDTEFLNLAHQLISDYPIISGNPWSDQTDVDKYYPMEKHQFGWLTQHFSDQCYFASTDFMRSIDYDTTHPIAKDYPDHGGNSFERRVAQYLANTNQYMLILKDYHYEHIDRTRK